jgi:hypothetical protein
MVNKRRLELFVKNNSYDVEKVEFSLNEISVKINKKLLNKINRQNGR